MADITIYGVRETQARLRGFGREAKAEMRRAGKAAADVVAADARGRVPRRSGDLAATIRTSGTMKGGKVRAGTGSVPYAGPVHFGWHTRPRVKWGIKGQVGGGPIAPNPFLYDAADRREREVRDVYKQRLAAVARKYD